MARFVRKVSSATAPRRWPNRKGNQNMIEPRPRCPPAWACTTLCGCLPPAPPATPSTTVDLRLASTSAFVKFAYPMTRLRAGDQLNDGHYLPADFVQLMYAHLNGGRDGRKFL